MNPAGGTPSRSLTSRPTTGVVPIPGSGSSSAPHERIPQLPKRVTEQLGEDERIVQPPPAVTASAGSRFSAPNLMASVRVRMREASILVSPARNRTSASVSSPSGTPSNSGVTVVSTRTYSDSRPFGEASTMLTVASGGALNSVLDSLSSSSREPYTRTIKSAVACSARSKPRTNHHTLSHDR